MENLRGHSDSEAFIKYIKIIVLTPHEYYMLFPALIISAAFEPMVRPSVQSRRFTLISGSVIMSNRGMCCFKGQRSHAAGCFKVRGANIQVIFQLFVLMPY